MSRGWRRHEGGRGRGGELRLTVGRKLRLVLLQAFCDSAVAGLRSRAESADVGFAGGKEVLRAWSAALTARRELRVMLFQALHDATAAGLYVRAKFLYVGRAGVFGPRDGKK